MMFKFWNYSLIYLVYEISKTSYCQYILMIRSSIEFGIIKNHDKFVSPISFVSISCIYLIFFWQFQIGCCFSSIPCSSTPASKNIFIYLENVYKILSLKLWNSVQEKCDSTEAERKISQDWLLFFNFRVIGLFTPLKFLYCLISVPNV